MSAICLFSSFIFPGFLSLEPIGLPCFYCVIDILHCPTITSILAGAFSTSIYDLVTFVVLTRASRDWYAVLYKWIIFWTSSSHLFVRRSRWFNFDAFHEIYYFSSFSNLCIYPPNARKTISLNWQSANHVVNISLVNGSRYLIMSGEVKPI